MNLAFSTIFAVDSDDGFSAPIEDEGDNIGDNDEDLTDPMNHVNPKPKVHSAKPQGKVFFSKEDAIQEAARRVENLQETRAVGDVMPPMWIWEEKPSPDEAEKEYQAEQEFIAMFGKKNKREKRKGRKHK